MAKTETYCLKMWLKLLFYSLEIKVLSKYSYRVNESKRSMWENAVTASEKTLTVFIKKKQNKTTVSAKKIRNDDQKGYKPITRMKNPSYEIESRTPNLLPFSFSSTLRCWMCTYRLFPSDPRLTNGLVESAVIWLTYWMVTCPGQAKEKGTDFIEANKPTKN